MAFNTYANFSVTCAECENCEMFPVGPVATCRELRDSIHDELGIDVREVTFDPDQDAGRCNSFDPTEKCLERIADGARPLAEQYGLTPPTGLRIPLKEAM